VGPRAVLDVVVKRKIPSPHRESNPRTPIVQPIAQRYTELSRLGDIRHAYNNLDETPEGKRSVGTPGHKREDNIKIDLREIRGGGVRVWAGFIWLRLVTSSEVLQILIKLRVP
jgi:hypothetical protein